MVSLPVLSLHARVKWYVRTCSDNILDSLLLGASLHNALPLLPQLGKHERSDAFNDAGKYGIAGIKQPALRQCRVVEVNAAFEHRVFRDS